MPQFVHNSDINPKDTEIQASSAETFVKYALSIGALELLPEGRLLKSSRISPYFFNSGLFNTGDSLNKLVKAYVGALGDLRPDVIFGPAYKGIPLAVAIVQAVGGKVGFAFNRKEEKTHGDGGTIVGASLEGKKVLIVDDVMTTGTSSGEAVKIIIANGGTPIGCAIAFNRQERDSSQSSAVQEFKETYKIPVFAAATLTNLISVLEQTPARNGDDEVGEMLDRIIAYKQTYGV